MDCMAMASPPVLARTETRKRAAGGIRRRPVACEVRCRAAAQTASSEPDKMRINHDMTAPVASLVACRVLIRRPEAAERAALFSSVATPGRRGELPPRTRPRLGAQQFGGLVGGGVNRDNGQESAAQDLGGGAVRTHNGVIAVQRPGLGAGCGPFGSSWRDRGLALQQDAQLALEHRMRPLL